MKIVVVDYGMGNIRSLIGAISYLDIGKVILSSDEKEIASADKLILPGVGAFNRAMQNIKKNNLDLYLRYAVIEKHIPVLGICLGMQLMGISSTENGYHEGLGYIDGTIHFFENETIKIPHVGFNQVEVNSKSKLYRNMDGN